MPPPPLPPCGQSSPFTGLCLRINFTSGRGHPVVRCLFVQRRGVIYRFIATYASSPAARAAYRARGENLNFGVLSIPHALTSRSIVCYPRRGISYDNESTEGDLYLQRVWPNGGV